MPIVSIVMGSKSDSESVQPMLDILKQMSIDYEVNVMSAHRTPEKVREFALGARKRGIEVIIAAAIDGCCQFSRRFSLAGNWFGIWQRIELSGGATGGLGI